MFEYFLLILGLIILLSFLYTSLSLAPWVPTKGKDLKRIKNLANLNPGEKLIELGCGDARVSSFLAKSFPESEVVGIEYSLVPYLAGKVRHLLNKQKNLSIKFGNLYKEDLSGYDVIYFFGFPTTNTILREKLWKELKVGAKVISYTFEIADWKGRSKKYKESPQDLSIYVYEK